MRKLTLCISVFLFMVAALIVIVETVYGVSGGEDIMKVSFYAGCSALCLSEIVRREQN